MPVITDAAAAWSAPVTLSEDEIWQTTAGTAFITTDPTSTDGDGDGIELSPGSGVLIRSGKEVRYRKGAAPARIVRMPV